MSVKNVFFSTDEVMAEKLRKLKEASLKMYIDLYITTYQNYKLPFLTTG